MGSIMGAVPCGLGRATGSTIPGAVNYEGLKWGVMPPATSPGQGYSAVFAAIANKQGILDGF